MTTLTDSQFATQLNAVQEMACVEELLAYLKQLKAVKIALESVGTFREQAVKYARLHAEALIRVVELGGADGLRSKRERNTATWLKSMSQEELEKYISMCESGMLITEVYRREVEYKEGLKRDMQEVKNTRSLAVETITEDGIIDFEAVVADVSNCLGKYDDKKLIEDVVDGIRKDLRAAGGVNARLEPIENTSSVYVLPERGNKNQQLDALAIRLFNIASTVRSFDNLLKATGISPVACSADAP